MKMLEYMLVNNIETNHRRATRRKSSRGQLTVSAKFPEALGSLPGGSPLRSWPANVVPLGYSCISSLSAAITKQCEARHD